MEIQQICTELNKLSGTQLQRVSSDENKIYLLFWDGEKSYAWVIDLNSKLPTLLPYNDKLPKKNIKKPWISFLDMHFSGAILRGIKPIAPGERSVVLSLNNIDRGEQEIIINLFPKGVNLILKSEAKQVSKFKVKEFPPIKNVLQNLPVRSIEQLVNESRQVDKPVMKDSVSPEKLHAKEVKRTQKAINKLSEDLENKINKIDELKQLGEYIKNYQSLDVPENLVKYIQTNLSVFENMNMAFEKSKKEKSKIEGSQSRFTELQDQLSALNAVENYGLWLKSKSKSTSSALKIKKDQKLKFKTVLLQGDCKVLLGSSAKNNSELIKASKPWYMWMHLRDYPSSHAVVICKKNEDLQRAMLIQAGKELIKHNFKSKKIKYEGLNFDLIFCQIRYLRQIKGQPGKVTYTNDKNVTIQM